MQLVYHPNIIKEAHYFVEDLRKHLAPLSVPIDPTSLFVDPESVPSRAYADTIKLLDRQIADFPNFDYKTYSA
jgi:hypothetical protein